MGGLRAAWLLTIFATLLGIATLGMQHQIDQLRADVAASRSNFNDLSSSVASVQLRYIAARRNGFEHAKSTADLEEALAESRRLATVAPLPTLTSGSATLQWTVANLPTIVFYSIVPAFIAVSLVGRKKGVYSKNVSRLIATCVIAYAILALMHTNYVAWMN